jgi:2-methylisocitrate lyase-like PEP mutase family enzyme
MTDKGENFRELHKKGAPFVLVNVWDQASAKLSAERGAQALATSSWAIAASMGLQDGEVSLDQALAHAENIIAATDLPVSGDFENGYVDDPDKIAQTVRLAAEVGLSGISIEDLDIPAHNPYAFELAVERIRAAVSAARALPNNFVLVARADGIMTGDYDIEEALKRLHAFEDAGADCLYAPMPATPADLMRICREISAPVNALAAGPYAKVSYAEFADMGVARISLGSSLFRHSIDVAADAVSRMLGPDGDFSRLSNSVGFDAFS